MKPDKSSEQEDNTEQDPAAVNEMDADGAPSEGVDVPEAFQAAMHKHLQKATKPMLSHVRSKVSEREDEIRNEEMKSKGKNGKMNMDNAPASVGDVY